MLIARIEKLYSKKGLNDAIKRARSYVDAGADGIMIHSKNKSPAEIINFSKNLKKIFPNMPLVAVPTSYNKVKENFKRSWNKRNYLCQSLIESFLSSYAEYCDRNFKK